MSRIVGFQSGHDVSYCILEDGIPIIHEELERFSREKSPGGDGLEFFFNQNPELTDITNFAFGNPNGRTGRYSAWGVDNKYEAIMQDMARSNGGKYYVIGHHQSHAANAFFTSDFDESLIITLDGGGTEKNDENDWVRDRHYPARGQGLAISDAFGTGLTAWTGIGNKINRIDAIRGEKVFSIGFAWNQVTSKIFGLSTGHPKGDQAGTVMAMGTIGNPDKYFHLFEHNIKAESKIDFAKWKAVADKSEEEAFDIAAGLQKATEEAFRIAITPIVDSYTGSNLCLSGGASLNCVMTTKIYDWFPKIKNIFCDPVPYDGGLSIGSARFVWHHILNNKRNYNNPKNNSSYLGRKYTEQDILTAIQGYRSENKQ